MSEAFSEEEIETLRKGAMGAGFFVSMSDRGFFDTFKEAGTLGKHVADRPCALRERGCPQDRRGKGPGFGVTSKRGRDRSRERSRRCRHR